MKLSMITLCNPSTFDSDNTCDSNLIFKCRKKNENCMLAADPFAFDLQDMLRVITKSEANLIRIHVGRLQDLSGSARRSASVPRLQSGLGGSHDPLRRSRSWNWTSAASRRRRVRLAETCSSGDHRQTLLDQQLQAYTSITPPLTTM